MIINIIHRLLCFLGCGIVAVTAWADDSDFPASMASGTLPVVYINTENEAPVVDKVTMIPAVLRIAMPASEGDDQTVDSEELTLKIRGRGNVSWQQEKKPYKLKFDSKESLLGMPGSKHYALLPQQGYCDIVADMMARRSA